MVRELFVHLCIMLSFMFLGGALFKNNPVFKNKKMKLLLGAIAGLLGSILMLFGIALTEGIRLDLRHMVLILSVLHGGMLSLSVAGAILIINRLLLFPITVPSLVGVLIILSCLAVFALIYRTGWGPLKKWIVMNAVGFLFNVVPLRLFIDGNDLWEIILNYSVVTVIGSVLVFYASSYISESNRNYQIMKEQLKLDFLTGLNNTRHFHTSFHDYFKKAARTGTPISFFMIDIDHFKSINDTYGHPAGDAVLQQLGLFLAESSRTGDFVSRMGGEEFAALVWNTTYEQAVVVAERWRMQIANKKFLLPSGQMLSLTVSIGVASTPPCTEANALRELADHALYRAKRLGRNQVC
ncbi:GGDEF domain-containing protein [Paenibacillus turpanensis]|uniref:GGDEF domain-containing protein n=1 Tax=Paenibacillus turpanensis TaxID=2689078 RepID=UPI00140D0FD9|nr:GGDEF domain-containing protein [Paenibacillus turpanensis]